MKLICLHNVHNNKCPLKSEKNLIINKYQNIQTQYKNEFYRQEYTNEIYTCKTIDPLNTYWPINDSKFDTK